ncbi:hypothetical protein LX36DRAFT_367793 [Colletotrichum falcatum]|nr:hypothetical protein LX36DRAFT_367793 [Colletotrichum falcatum]
MPVSACIFPISLYYQRPKPANELGRQRRMLYANNRIHAYRCRRGERPRRELNMTTTWNAFAFIVVQRHPTLPAAPLARPPPCATRTSGRRPTIGGHNQQAKSDCPTRPLPARHRSVSHTQYLEECKTGRLDLLRCRFGVTPKARPCLQTYAGCRPCSIGQPYAQVKTPG